VIAVPIDRGAVGSVREVGDGRIPAIESTDRELRIPLGHALVRFDRITMVGPRGADVEAYPRTVELGSARATHVAKVESHTRATVHILVSYGSMRQTAVPADGTIWNMLVLKVVVVLDHGESLGPAVDRHHDVG
jgi:adenosine deaminase